MKRIGAILFSFFLLLPLKVKGDIADIERELKDIPLPAGGQPPDAYDKFLTKIRLREQWHLALKKVDIIKIVEDVKWENVKWENTKCYLYFSNIVKPFLSIPNLHIVVGEGPSDYQAALNISASFRALSKKYSEGVLYTGAYVEGKISLETREGFKIEDNFTGNIEPPDELPMEVKQHIETYKSPESAPFYKVLDVPGSFIDKFARIYYKCFGRYALAAAILECTSPSGAPYQTISPLLKELGEQLFDPLVYLLKNSKWEWIQIGSVIALEKTKLPKAIPYLLEYAAIPAIPRREVIDEIPNIVKERGGIEVVINCLKHENPRVRGLSAEVLGRLGGDRAVEGLIYALKDESPNVRMTAVRWLGNLKDKRAVEPLIAVLKNKKEQEEIRVAAVKALELIGDPRARDPLMEVLQQRPSFEIMEAIQKALQVVPLPTLSTEDIPSLIKRWHLAVEQKNYLEKGETEKLLVAAGSKVIDSLIPIITNKKEKREVRESAFNILLLIKDQDKRLIEPCLKIAKDKEDVPTIRQAAIQCLGNLKAKEATDLLLSFLTDVKQPLWLRAVSALNLGKIGDTRAIEALYFALKLNPVRPPSEDKTEGEFAFWDVSITTTPPTIHHYYDLPSSAAKALVCIGIPALERIKDALADENPRIRVAIAMALRESNEQWAKELLLPLGQDEDMTIRLIVAYRLAQENDPRFLDVVLSILNDEKAGIADKEEAVKITAEWVNKTKSEFSDKRFVKPLLALMKQLMEKSASEEEESISYYMDSVLGLISRMKDPSLLKEVASLLNNENKRIRSSALYAILYIGPREDIVNDLIYTSKNDEDPDNRETALDCLAKLNNPVAISAIVDAYKYDPDARIRSRAFSLLKNLKSPYSIKPLAEFLISCQDTLRRQEIASFLKWTDLKRASEVIIPYLKEKDAKVKKSAAEALGYLESPYGVEELLELMIDENKEVREAARGALKKIAHNDYGEDVGKWRIWWERNRDYLLKLK
ncbi:HEAT repeat domain-containing protein [bacterium]|nr:HEAT repeat domain-containing protein [bacterium]